MKKLRKRDLTEKNILDTAMLLFSKHGFENTSMRKIAKQAKISAGLVYHYFEGKNDLLVQLFTDRLADIKLKLKHAKDEIVSRKQNKPTIEDYIRTHFRILKEKSQFWRLVFLLKSQDNIWRLLEEKLKENKQSIVADIVQLLRPNFPNNTQAEALLLYSSMEGIIFHYVFDEQYPIDQMVDLLVHKYQ